MNTKELLNKHGFTFSKALGQNFLTDPRILGRIAEESGAEEGCGVLEIGPGMGTLTRELADLASKVVAVELDTRLAPILAETLAACDNVSVVYDDAMKVDLRELIETHFQGLRKQACANLPYYITTPVIAKLLESRLFESVTILLQKEVADRICAKEGSKIFGAFTVFCQYFASPEVLFTIPPGAFIPSPKVTSALLKLTVHTDAPYAPRDEALFFSIVRAGFNQRRKTLANALNAQFGSRIDKEKITTAIAEITGSETSRAEQLSLEKFCALSDAFSELLKAQ